MEERKFYELSTEVTRKLGLQDSHDKTGNELAFSEHAQDCFSTKSVFPDGESFSAAVCRYLTEDETVTFKQSLTSIYKEIYTFLKRKEYTIDLRKELEKSNPEYLNVLEKLMKDIEKADHGIVIAGETSAGKSTLINKILGKRIFKGQTAESTSSVCKIRNSEKVRIFSENKNGDIKEVEVPFDCDTESKTGIDSLMNVLMELTNKTKSKESINYKYIDVGFPIPFLKENTILVDTPGIGGSTDGTQKLMEYLPNADSFIFVIDVSSAGGLQNDRLPLILDEVMSLISKNDMPCFNAKDAIFVTNKWDLIFEESDDDDDDDDESEETRTWNKLISTLEERWPSLNKDNIFKLSILDIEKEEDGFSKTEFRRFKQLLESNVQKANNIRIKQHLRSIHNFLMSIAKGLTARVLLGNKNEREQQECAKAHLEKLNTLAKTCFQFQNTTKKIFNEAAEEVVNKCKEYMSTEEGKTRILNPPNHTPIMKVTWMPSRFSEELHRRFHMFIKDFMQTKYVTQKFQNIQDSIKSFYHEISSNLSEMENVWTYDMPCPWDNFFIRFHDEVDPITLGLGIFIGVPVLVGFAGVAIALSPIIIPTIALLGRDKRKQKVIDEEYNTFKDSVEGPINEHIRLKYSRLLSRSLEIVTDGSVLKRIHYFETLIRTLVQSRAAIIANKESIFLLSKEVKKMIDSVEEIQEKIYSCNDN